MLFERITVAKYRVSSTGYGLNSSPPTQKVSFESKAISNTLFGRLRLLNVDMPTCFAHLNTRPFAMSNTTIMFNGQAIFGAGRHALRPGSWRRESTDRGFAGLDGVMSVDLGRRERKLKQRGVLSAGSIAALVELIENVSAHIDGQCYQLLDQHGVAYSNVRMDSLSLLSPIAVGSQSQCEYEIVYTQLGT